MAISITRETTSKDGKVILDQIVIRMEGTYGSYLRLDMDQARKLKYQLNNRTDL